MVKFLAKVVFLSVMAVEIEFSWLTKKLAKKALIPLPPTGFASVFFAKGVVVQMKAAPKPSVGAVRHLAIARSARFCKEVQQLCAVPKASQVGGQSLGALFCKERRLKISFLSSFFDLP